MTAAFLVILAVLGAGYLCGRFRLFADGAAEALHRFVIYVCLPAVILRLVPKLSWDPSLAALVVTPWLLLAIVAPLVHAVAAGLGWRREVLAALLLCVPLGNTSFVGYPMVAALVNPEAVRYAVLYDQLGSFFMLATYGLVVVARFSGSGDVTVRSVALRLIKFPPFIALLMAVVPVRHPPVLDLALEQVGNALVPAAMFAVGLSVKRTTFKSSGPIVFGLTVKMVLMPLVAFAIGWAFGAPAVIIDVLVLESAMPPMITAGALAIMARLAPEVASALTGYGVLLSMGTLPIIARLLH